MFPKRMFGYSEVELHLHENSYAVEKGQKNLIYNMT